ncbi:MAG: glycosyltransferase family 2 protein [Candidatus Poribacteria bacterium]|nr:glycosyltransferase family 2 protein [Candidatus Poribacteria bacterium]
MTKSERQKLSPQILSQPINTGLSPYRTPALLSVIIPAFNEAETIRQVVKEVWAVPIDTEIIIVNDGSTDGTYALLEQMRDEPGLKIVQCKENRGKGFAIRIGLEYVTGDFVVIQDADLEVRPKDLPLIFEALQKGTTQVVYGSRFLEGRQGVSLQNYMANRLLTGFANLLYQTHITDEATCYKAFDASLITGLNLTCEGFEFCPEVTAKVLRAGYHIHEVPISYFPRTKRGGKKLRFWREGMRAVWTLLKYRFTARSTLFRKPSINRFR